MSFLCLINVFSSDKIARMKIAPDANDSYAHRPPMYGVCEAIALVVVIIATTTIYERGCYFLRSSQKHQGWTVQEFPMRKPIELIRIVC